MTNSWLRRWLGREHHSAKKRRPAPGRLRLEPLEDRLTPALFLVQTTFDAPGPVTQTAPGIFSAPTLRAAIDAANDEVNHPGVDTITFELSLWTPHTIDVAINDTGHPGTSYAFGPTAFIISSDIFISAVFGQQITLDANNNRRMFAVTAGATLSLESLTLTNGNATGGRGGNSIVAGAGGGGAGLGGAIFSNGTVNISGCTLTNNAAQGGAGGSAGNANNPQPSFGGAGGGAVGGNGGDAALTNMGNAGGGGGGVGGDGGNGTGANGGAGGAQEDGITRAGESGNGSSGGGGGGGGNFGNGGSGQGVTSAGFGGGGGGAGSIPENTTGGAGGFGGGGGGGAGPGTWAPGGAGGFGGGGGGAEFSSGPGGQGGFGAGDGGGGTDSNAVGGGGGGGGAGLGGAIFMNTGSVLNVINTTFTGNTAAGGAGGGVVAGGHGQGLGAAVFNRGGTVTINQSTLAGNTADDGGAVFNLADTAGQSAVVHLRNSILADTVGGADVVNQQLAGTAAIIAGAPRVNIIESGIHVLSGTVNQSGVIRRDPRLGPLADNGGTTQTLMPGAGPAINAGRNGVVTDLPRDQRGAGFARIVNGRVDLGAVESPTVRLSVRINGGQAQRSLVTHVDVVYSGPVTVRPGAFRLQQAGVDSIPLQHQVIAGTGQTVVRLTFATGNLNPAALGDGQYVLTINDARVRDARGQTVGGIDQVRFQRTFGDTDGDGTFDAVDRGRLGQALLRQGNWQHWLPLFQPATVNDIRTLIRMGGDPLASLALMLLVQR